MLASLHSRLTSSRPSSLRVTPLRTIKQFFTKKKRPSRGVGNVRSPLWNGDADAAYNFVPEHIVRPEYARRRDGAPLGKDLRLVNEGIEIKSKQTIDAMRPACKLASEALDYVGEIIKPGMTTEEVDSAVHNFIIERNAYPSPLNYQGFPKSCCTSVNEVICHGIPDDLPLKDTDIVNVDITVYLNGFHGDTSRMYVMPNAPSSAKKLVDVTKQCLDAAIDVCKPGVPFWKIGETIAKIASKHSYGIPRDFAGHGIGAYFHGPPFVFHFKNRLKENVVGGTKMEEGMVFTIEPMITDGAASMYTLSDHWTALTTDHSLCAQWEHTIAITADGAEILT